MILLIGGTSETAPLASGLAAAGYEVLVSTATAVPLEIAENPRISRRTGRLDEERLAALGKERAVRAIVDAAHPYAVAAHAVAANAARRLGIPCIVFRRQETPASDDDLVSFAAGHAEAAAMAFAIGLPVLLTTGSRNLAPYTEAARRTGIPLTVRILDAPESLEACRAAGIPEGQIIAGRGPFTAEENLAAIRRFGIGVIVTKESGQAGGFDAKLAAARQANCHVIIICRPETSEAGPAFESQETLIAALRDLVRV